MLAALVRFFTVGLMILAVLSALPLTLAALQRPHSMRTIFGAVLCWAVAFTIYATRRISRVQRLRRAEEEYLLQRLGD